MNESSTVRTTVALGFIATVVVFFGVWTTIDTIRIVNTPVVAKRVMPTRTPAQTRILLQQLLPLPQDFKYVALDRPSTNDMFEEIHYRSVAVDFPEGLSAKAQDDNLRALTRQLYKVKGMPVIAYGFAKGKTNTFTLVATLTFGPPTEHWDKPNTDFDLSDYKTVIEHRANVPNCNQW